MVSGALGKISRLCPPLSDGPSDDGFQLTLFVSKFTYLINEWLLGTLKNWLPTILVEDPETADPMELLNTAKSIDYSDIDKYAQAKARKVKL